METEFKCQDHSGLWLPAQSGGCWNPSSYPDSSHDNVAFGTIMGEGEKMATGKTKYRID